VEVTYENGDIDEYTVSEWCLGCVYALCSFIPVVFVLMRRIAFLLLNNWTIDSRKN
jgi:hypothetical protein